MSSVNTPALFSLRHRRAIILSLAVAACLYLLTIFLTGGAQATAALQKLGISGVLVLLACSFTSYLIRFLRWQYYLRLAGWQLPWPLHLAYYLAGFALTTSPGKAGETVRSVLLRPHGIPYPTSLACFFTERLLDVLIVGLLAVLATLHLSHGHSLILLVFSAALAFIALLQSRLPINILGLLRARIHNTRLQHLLGQLQNLLSDSQDFLTGKALFTGLLFGLMAWGLQGLAFYYLLQILDFALALPVAMGIFATGLLAGALSMIPGGIGATEAIMALLLAAAGAAPEFAIIVPLISRLTSLWFAVILGLLANAWLASRYTAVANAD